MRLAICILLTIILFVVSRYFGPNREFTVSARLGEISLEHEAPRSVEYAVPGGEARASADIRVLGRVVIEATARPAPATTEEVPLLLRARLKGTKGWEIYPLDEIVAGDNGAAHLRFVLPGFPWTSRVYYQFVTPESNGSHRVVLTCDDGEPMMIKFKGPVPAVVLIPHILLMFAGICLLMRCMWGAVDLIRDSARAHTTARFAWWAFAAMFIGGVPIGFMMNYYAFDVIWEAVPFGSDITDNKTQVALIFWGLAAIFLTRRPGRHAGIFAVGAGALSLGMYLIPHSL